MNKPKHHFILCASFRVAGDPKGICNKKGAVSLLQYLENEANDRGMDDILISSSGCLKYCDNGPVLVIYPEGDWYGGVNEGVIDEILDAVEVGKKAEQYLLS